MLTNARRRPYGSRLTLTKIAATLAAVGSLTVMASTAEAEKKTFHYEGSTSDQLPAATVSFDKIKRASGERKIKNFSVNNLFWSCEKDETFGSIPYPQHFPGAMPVQVHGVFSGSAPEAWYEGNPQTPSDGPFTVEGDVDTVGAATGTLEKEYEFSFTEAYCSSGERAWTAQKVVTP